MDQVEQPNWSWFPIMPSFPINKSGCAELDVDVQAKPGDWDLRLQLAEQPRAQWKVATFAGEMKIGDVVYLWESGPNAACSRAASSPPNRQSSRCVPSSGHTCETPSTERRSDGSVSSLNASSNPTPARRTH